ncbi:metallophosphoesterase family protein [Micromonospora sp. NPDC047793]|uniref:metallophosphoesterase family protein n=1 Tax=Micromonospora sp. NPDC047793 TaxID=3154342 RepID=UPI0033E61675
MSVTWMTVGAVTDTSVVTSVKVTGSGNVRVGRSTSADFSSPTWSSATATSNNHAKVSLTGLTPGTRYWWRVEDAGVVDAAVTGQFRTAPVAAGSPMSFTIGCVGDAGITPVVPGVGGAAPNRLSNHPIFDTIRIRALAEDWQMLAHDGDWCYYDLGSGNHGLSATASLAQYRGMFDDVMLQPRQHELYRSVPTLMLPDDHEFGPNDSDSSSPGRNNFLAMYRERLPHYPLGAGSGNPIFHSTQFGRVLIIASDTRADRVPGSTMLGATQLAWLEDQLATSTADALIWLMPTPWLGLGADTWAGFPTERSTIAGWLTAGDWPRRMMMINADAHCLAMSSVAGNPHGGFPVALCASLDASPHTWTGQYDMGMWPGREQYATVRVDDAGGDIALTTTLWRRNRAISWLTVNTGGATRIEAGPPANVLAL